MYLGIGIAANLGARLVMTRQIQSHILMHKALTKPSPNLRSFTDGLLLDIQGFQSKLSGGVWFQPFHPDLVFSAFTLSSYERRQRQDGESYLSQHGVPLLPP